MKFASSVLAIMVLTVLGSAAYADPATDNQSQTLKNQQAAIRAAEKAKELIQSMQHTSPKILPGETVAHYAARLEQQAKSTAAFFAARAAANSQ
jgi:hypothetical protein